MVTHNEMQKRLKSAIQQAILNEGRTEGTGEIHLTNTDVVEALLEVTGLYSSLHGFESYSRTDLAFKHALTIMGHIERFKELGKSGKLPFNIVPRSKVN